MQGLDAEHSIVRRTARLLLTPAPGRLHNTLMLVAGVVVVTLIGEVFRIPETGTACYVVIFVSRGERTSTVTTALGIAVLAVVASFASILVTMASLSQPALRIGLMALATFAAMFLSRAARSGVAFFAVGFITVYALTATDSVQQLGLEPVTVSNVAGGGLPSILLVPPEEELVRLLLWISVVLALPAIVIALINKAVGRDPAVLLRRGLAQRLDASAAFLRREPGAGPRLEAIARRGSPELLTLADLAQKDHGAEAESLQANKAAIRAVIRLMLACLAFRQTRPEGDRPAWMSEAGRRCTALRDGQEHPCAGAPGGDPLQTEVDGALDDLERAQRARASPPLEQAGKQRAGFWADDAFQAANYQFALKVTFAVMVCYTLNNALDWPGIDTSVVTCFFTALGSLGESGHKMTLRICGCLLGAAMGIAAILLLMPGMTDIMGLLALVAAGTLVAGWVACGSDRVAYAGFQIGIAFYLTVLQDYGPTTNMEAARDRIIGILLGNVVTYLVLSTIWPVRVHRLIAGEIAGALGALGKLLRGVAEPADARERFASAIGKAQGLLEDGLYEGAAPSSVRLDEAAVARIQALIIPVSMLANDAEHTSSVRLADWFDAVAGWLEHERASASQPPAFPACRETFDASPDAYDLLQRDLIGLPFYRDGSG